jgi:hypothetical protein
MTKENGLPDNRKIKRKRKKQTTAKDKNGRCINLGSYNNCTIKIHVPNIQRFFTTQLTISMWIKPLEDVDQHSFEHQLNIIKRKIKDIIRLNGFKYFKKESIVVLKTTQVENRTAENQYLTLEIVFYMNDMIFERRTIERIIEPFAHQCIDELILTSKYFEVKRNMKKESKNKYE